MQFHQRIPRSYADVTNARSWLLWALFGNDDDGIYGEKIPPGLQPGFGADRPQTSEQFWRWWFRNRAHNACFVVLRRQVIDPIYIIGRSEPYAAEKYRSVVLRFRPFFIKLGFFFIGWRADKPIAEGWGGKYGAGGGAFDIGAKRIA